MKKVKTLVVYILCIITMLSCGTITAFAAEQSYTSYINSAGSFLGPSDYWKYKNLGYKYTNSTCATSGAYFNVSIRRYASEESVIYKTVGTANNNPSKVADGTYYGATFNNARHSGDTYDYCYNYYIQIKNNNGKPINAKTFIKYSRDY